MRKNMSFLSLVLCAALAACSGGGAAGGASSAAADTPAAKLAQLEDSGAIPKLDRSDSLAGPDADNNGVRDDVDAYIAKQYPPDPKKQVAIRQLARTIQQSLLVDVKDKDAVREVARQMSYAHECVYLRLDDKAGDPHPARVSTEIESIIPNTKQRLKAYLAFNTALDGTVWTLPQGDTCNE